MAVVIGVPWQGVDPAPGWAALGWLAALAMTGQVCGWMLIAAALPRLRAEEGGTLLLLQPVLAVAFGAAVLGERPGISQIGGCALVLAAVRLAGRPRGGRSGGPAPADEPAAEPAPAPDAESRGSVKHRKYVPAEMAMSHISKRW
jgi:drug/metabolite transporter (DMT)-like permease